LTLGSSLDALTLWFSGNDYAVHTSRDEFASLNHGGALLALKRRLNSRTKGLLEMHNSLERQTEARVEYLHRTAWDWIRNEWGMICKLTKAEFDPHLRLLKGATLKTMKLGPVNTQYERRKLASSLFECVIRVEYKEVNMPLFMDILDKIDIELAWISEGGSKKSEYLRGDMSESTLGRLTHWTDHLEGPEIEGGYVGFIAQIPIFPSVRAKMPSMDKAQRTQIAKMVTQSAGVTRGFEEREKLLLFLLHQGINVVHLKAKVDSASSLHCVITKWEKSKGVAYFFKKLVR